MRIYFRYFLLFIFIIYGCEDKEFLNPNDSINIPPHPIPLYPKDDTLISDNPIRTLRFIAYPGVSPDLMFEFQISPDRNFNSLTKVIYESDSISSEETLSIDCSNYYGSYDFLLPERCFWRVRAKNEKAGDEGWSSWSDTDSFRMKFPAVAINEDIPGINNFIYQGNHSYFRTSYSVYSMNTSDPESPELMDRLDFDYSLHDLERFGNTLFVTASNFLVSIGIDNPGQMELLHYYYPPEPYQYHCRDFEILFPFVVIKESHHGYPLSFEVTAQDTLILKDSLNLSVNDMFSIDSFLIIATSSGLMVYTLDASGMFHLEEVYSLDVSPVYIRKKGDSLYCTCFEYGVYASFLLIIDISSLPSINVVKEVEIPHLYPGPIFPAADYIIESYRNYIYIYSLQDTLMLEGKIESINYRSAYSIDRYIYVSTTSGLHVIKL